MIRGEAADLEKLQAAMTELEKEIGQARQKLRDMNWNAISSLEDVPASN